MLDFSTLNDEQLVELIRESCAEAGRRGAAVAAAAKQTIFEEVERARVTRQAREAAEETLRQNQVRQAAREEAQRIQREAETAERLRVEERERTQWAKKKGVAQALDALYDLTNGDTIVAWIGSTNERRIFFQSKPFGGITYATLYVTGNRKNPPGSFEFPDKTLEGREELAEILRAIAEEWISVKIPLKSALAWSGDAIPLPTKKASAA
jgi:hypothetical protein